MKSPLFRSRQTATDIPVALAQRPLIHCVVRTLSAPENVLPPRGAEKKRAHRADTYWGRPVPGFGDPDARLLLVGLAPAAHGANRTGRMFTGDGTAAPVTS